MTKEKDWPLAASTVWRKVPLNKNSVLNSKLAAIKFYKN